MSRCRLAFAVLVTVAVAIVPARARSPLHRTMPSVAENRTFRLKMVAAYGPSTWDDLLIARRCLRCGWVTARQAVLPGTGRPDSPTRWLERVIDLSQSMLHRPCPSCRSTCAGPGFETRLMAGLSFLEAGGDLQLVADLARDKPTRATLTLVKLDGKLTALPWPVTPDEFEQKVGAPFSVRRAWRDLVSQHGADEHPAFHRIQDGYFILVRPALHAEDDADRIKKETVAILDNLTKQVGSLHVEGLKDLEDSRRPFTRDTYHDWLSEHESAIASGVVGPMAAVHPASFLQAFVKEAKALGVEASITTTKDLEVVLSRGPWRRAVRCIGPLLKMIHQGQSFQQGVAPLLEEVNRVTGMDRLAARITAIVKDRCAVEPHDGSLLVIRPREAPAKDPGVSLNLESLVEKIDAVKDPDGRIARVIGYDAKAGKFAEAHADGSVCHCGQPTQVSIKLRPKGFLAGRQGDLLAEDREGVVVAAARECRDHIQYLVASKPFASLPEARKRFAETLDRQIFSLADVGVVRFGKKVLPYAVGQDLSTAVLEPSLVKGLLAAVREALDQARTTECAPLPGTDGLVAALAAYQHVVVLSPTPLDKEARVRLLQLVGEALVGPYGRTEPGGLLNFYREHSVSKVKAQGQFEQR